jgi:protein arginine N-methyltransferase 2
MTGYQPKAYDGERLAKGDVITDGDSESDYVDADEDEIVTQGQALISGILEYAPMEDVQKLLDEDAPLWYQDKDGWSALHAAASVEDPELVKKLLQHGALWNSGKSSLSPALPGRTNH